MNGTRTLLLRVLTQSNYIQLNKDLIKALGLEKAAVIGDMISFDAYLKEQNKDEDGWFYYTYENLNESLCLSKYQLMNATSDLEELNILKTKKQGVPCRKYYKINYEIITLIIVEISQKLKNFTTRSQRTLPPAVKKLAHLINNINNTNNNKINNIEFLGDSNESLKTKEALASLSLNNKKTNIPKEKKFNITPIENNKDFLLLLKEWNSTPNATKHNKLDTKTVVDAFAWFNRLLDGSFCRYATNVTADWLKNIDAPFKWLSKKWTIEEIKEGIRRIGLQWQGGYWPYTEEEKKKILPKSLATSFYSPYNKSCPSVFFKVMAKAPIQNGQLTENEESQYKPYLDIYNVALNINDRDKPRIVKYIKSILNVHKSVCNSLIKVNNEKIERHVIEEELGTNFNSAIGFINIPEILIKNHADFIYECKMSWKDFKLSAVSFSPHGGLWDKFIEWLENRYNIKLWLEDDEAEYLAMRYSNYKRESNNKPKKEKSIKKRIKELEEIIKSKNQPEDVLMLFEEELDKLKSELERKAM